MARPRGYGARMRRLPLLLVPAALAVWWLWPVQTEVRIGGAQPASTDRTAPVRARPPPPTVGPEPVTSTPAPDPVLPKRAQAVREACDLPLETSCEGSTCVVHAATPSMDGVFGWLQLGLSSPSFVGSVLARDAGVRALPCPDAIAALEIDAIRMLPTPTGEVWCAGSGPGHRELCERATGVQGFTGETRLLRF